MAVTFRAKGASGEGTTCTCGAPAATADGDWLLALIRAGNSGVAVTAPAGWRLEANLGQLRFYTKEAASEGASWDWTAGTSIRGSVYGFYPAAANPYMVEDPKTDTGAGGSVTVAAVNASTTEAVRVVACVAAALSGMAFTLPSGWTDDGEVIDGGSSGYVLAHKAVSATGIQAATSMTVIGSAPKSHSLITFVLGVATKTAHIVRRPVQQPRPIRHLQ